MMVECCDDDMDFFVLPQNGRIVFKIRVDLLQLWLISLLEMEIDCYWEKAVV